KNKGVSYNGVLLKTEVIGTIKKYLMFSLPTRYYGEGAPGALVESLIAGVPVLVSSYSQVNALIQDNENGIIYEIGNKEDLKNKLLYIYKNPEKIIAMRKAAFESGKKFLYSGNRELFLSSILGDQNK
ncbi:MAG: glycosyltransferase, partial [Bacilli bacterium]